MTIVSLLHVAEVFRPNARFPLPLTYFGAQLLLRPIKLFFRYIPHFFKLFAMQPAVFWEGTPSGKIVKLGGIESYIAEPKSKTGKAVVLFPDAGGETVRKLQLAACQGSVMTRIGEMAGP